MRIFILLLFTTYSVFGQSAVDDPQDQKIEAKELKAEQSFTEGMKYFLIEDFEKARAEFKKNISVYGEQATVYYMLSKSENALNLLDYSLASAKKAVELDDENFFYLQHLGDLQFKNNLYKDATATVKKTLKLKPNYIEGYLLLVDIALIENKDADALKVLNDMEKAIGPSEKITQSKQAILLKKNKVDAALKEGKKRVKNEPEYVLQQSQILISNNRYSDAAAMLKSAIDENPNFIEAYGLLSELYSKQNDKAACKEVLEHVMAQGNMPYAVKINSLGNFIKTIKDNDFSEALSFCEKIIEKHPEEARTFVYKGDLNIKSGQLKLGRDAYLQAVKNDNSIFEAWLAIIELDVKLSLFDDLVKHADKALEYYPNYAYFWYHHGFGLIQKRAYDDAIISFEEAQKLNTNNKDLKNHINAYLAEIYFKNNETEKAESLFEAVLKEDPNSEQVLNTYSFLLASKKKDLEKAQKMAEILLSQKPNQAAYLDTYAFVLAQNNNLAKANQMIDKAIENSIQPNSGILEHKGDILFKLGQKDAALDFWKKAFELNKLNKKLENKIKDRTIIE